MIPIDPSDQSPVPNPQLARSPFWDYSDAFLFTGSSW